MSTAESPVILTYHSISFGRSPLKIAPSLFVEQMEWLSRKARVVPLEEMVEALELHRSLPESSVALTFDDGFRDFYTSAAPVLRRLNFPAAVFLCSSYCGCTNRWPGQPPWVDEQPLLDWKQVVELVSQGFTLGAHTMTHRDISALPLHEALGEIVGSQREIEALTGKPARFFCYPYGRWNRAVRELVSLHFRAACSTRAEVLDSASDRFALPRVDAHYVRHPAAFRSLFTNRFRTYIAARRLVRRLRRQPEGSHERS